MLVGNILSFLGPKFRKTLLLLWSHRASFILFFRKRFLAISMNHGRAEQSGLNVRFGTFLFYASFGLS